MPRQSNSTARKSLIASSTLAWKSVADIIIGVPLRARQGKSSRGILFCRRPCALDYPQLSAIAQPWAINRRTGLPCEHGGVGASFAAATRLRRWGMSSSDAFPRARRNPDADPAELEWAGYVVEQAVGASLGLIGPDVLGLAVEVRKDGVISMSHCSDAANGPTTISRTWCSSSMR